jgi:hypothetical protein
LTIKGAGMSTEDCETLSIPFDSREEYIAKFSRPATVGEAKCSKCDNVAFVYPGDANHMGICIVCIMAETEKRIQNGVFKPI